MIAAIDNIVVERQSFPDDSPAAGRNLRLLIDARKLYDGGIGVYTQNLIRGLLQTGEGDISAIVKPDEVIPAEWHGYVKVIEDSAKPYSFDEMWNLAKRIDFSKIDLFHVPHYTLPFKIPVPAVITVHDLIHIKHPEKKYYPWIAGPIIRSSLKRASRILTVSNASKRDIDSLVHESGKIMSKIRVVPNAVDDFYMAKSEIASRANNTKAKVSGRYIAAVFSNLKPHKGLKDLLLAFQIAQKKFDKDLKLALVGQGTESIVGNSELLELTSKTKGINIVGSVTKDELADIYMNAEALVVPSLAEGFYLPVIEAQAMGTPVITRPVPSILELVTDRDIVCRDFSVEALAEKINEHAAKIDREESIELPVAELHDHLMRFDQFSLAKTVLQIYKETLQLKPGAV